MSSGRITKVKDGGTYEQYDSLNPPGQPVEEGEGNEEEGGPESPSSPSAHGAMAGASVQGVGDNGGTAGSGGDGGKKRKSIFGGIGKKDKKEKLGKKELRERIHMLEEEREEREAKGREMEANLKRQVEENKATIVEQTKEKKRLLDEDKAKMDAQTKEIYTIKRQLEENEAKIVEQTKENDSKERQMEAKMDAQTKEIDTMKRQLEENKVEQTKEKEEMKRKMEEKENEIEKRVKDKVEVETKSKLDQQQKDHDALLRLKAREIQTKDESLKGMDKNLLQKDEAILAKDKDILEKDEDLKSKDEEIKKKDGELKLKDEEIKRKDQALQDRDEEMERKEEELRKKDEDLVAKDKELKSKDEDLVARDGNLKDKDEALIAKDRDLISKDKEVIDKDREIVAKDRELGAKQQEIEALTAEVKEMKTARETVQQQSQRVSEKVEVLEEEKQKLEQLLVQEKKNQDGEFEEIQKERDELENEIQRMKGKPTEEPKEEENTELTDKVQELEEQAQNLREEVAGLTNQLQKSEENGALQMKKLKDVLELKTQKLTGAEERCAQLNAINQKLIDEGDEIKKALKSTSVDQLQDSPRLECDSPEEEVCLLGISSEAKEKIRNLESENGCLENRIRNLEHQLTLKDSIEDIPSNVYHFSHQLSKLVDREGDSFQVSPRPLSRDTANRVLQTIGVTPGFKHQGYVVAVFHALNNAQCVLLNYTSVGEVIGHEGSSEVGAVDSTCSSGEKEYAAENMTDSDKKKLIESQQELEKLKKENEDILSKQEQDKTAWVEMENYLKKLETEKSDLTSRLEALQGELSRNAASKDELTGYVHELEAQKENSLSRPQEETVSRKKTAELAQETAERVVKEGQPVEELNKRLRANYLKVNEEKILLLEQLEERDAQIKRYRDELAVKDAPPATLSLNVQRSLSAGEAESLEDSKAEVRRLKNALKEKEVEVDNLNVQLDSFQEVACGKMDLGKEVVELKKKLKESEDKIRRLKDNSELAQVSESLRVEIVAVRKQLKEAEVSKQDIEDEKDIWKNEIDAEKENISKLQDENDRLRAALKFLQSRHPSDGADLESSLNNSSVDMCENMDESAGFDNVLNESRGSELMESLHKVELTGLNDKISRKDVIIKSLASTKSAMERRLRAMTEERDRLAQQNIELFAMKANYKGQLSRFDEIKHSVEETREQAEHMHERMRMMTAEIESLSRKKEALVKEKECLLDELEARKYEAIVIKEDFEKERQDRAKMASTRADDVGKWKVLEQQYADDVKRLQGELKLITHESEQEIFQLKAAHKAEEKKTRDLQITLQREIDETLDRLREEKDMVTAEMNRMMELYQTEREENKKHSEDMEILRAEKCSLEECVRELENEKMKKEKLHELTASEKRDLKEKLEERESTLAAMEIRLKDVHSKWIETKEQLDGAIADTSRLTDETLSKTQQVKQFKKQSDTYRDQLQQERVLSQSLIKEERGKMQHQIQEGRVSMEHQIQEERVSMQHQIQEERVSMQHQIQEERVKMQRQVAMFQEDIRSKEEEHTAEITLLQASHESAQMDLESDMTPLKREVEQLRSQRMNETQMSDVFRKVEREKKDLENQRDESSHKYQELLETYLEARDTLLKHNLPLPKQTKLPMAPPSRNTVGVRPSRQSITEHQVRPYQDPMQRSFTHLDGSIADNIPRGSHPRGHLAPMRGERGGAPKTQANRSPPVPQYPRSPQQGHQQLRGMGGEGPRYNQEQLGQKSAPRRDPNLHYQQQAPHQPHRVPVEVSRPASQDNYTPPVSGHGNYPPPMPGQGTHHPGGRPVDRSENPLIQDISDDISQAAAYVQSEGSVISMSSIEDPRPMDSNLICPMCKVQFRIGQIQPYKRHVDECHGTRNSN